MAHPALGWPIYTKFGVVTYRGSENSRSSLRDGVNTEIATWLLCMWDWVKIMGSISWMKRTSSRNGAPLGSSYVKAWWCSDIRHLHHATTVLDELHRLQHMHNQSHFQASPQSHVSLLWLSCVCTYSIHCPVSVYSLALWLHTNTVLLFHLAEYTAHLCTPHLQWACPSEL